MFLLFFVALLPQLGLAFSATALVEGLLRDPRAAQLIAETEAILGITSMDQWSHWIRDCSDLPPETFLTISEGRRGATIVKFEGRLLGPSRREPLRQGQVLIDEGSFYGLRFQRIKTIKGICLETEGVDRTSLERTLLHELVHSAELRYVGPDVFRNEFDPFEEYLEKSILGVGGEWDAVYASQRFRELTQRLPLDDSEHPYVEFFSDRGAILRPEGLLRFLKDLYRPSEEHFYRRKVYQEGILTMALYYRLLNQTPQNSQALRQVRRFYERLEQVRGTGLSALGR